MSISVNPGADPYARILSVGDAPASQTGAGGQWVNAWSVTGVTAVQKADVTNSDVAWSALKYTDVLPSLLAGGDIYHGDLGVSGQSAATSTVKQEIDGKEALRFNLTEAAQSVTINLSSFYANDDGTGYAEGARIRLFDADGNLVGVSFATANSSNGNQQVQLSSAVAFRSVEISAGAQRADHSFSFGGYSNSDGSFGSDSYTSGTSGTSHGSDFLVHSISFALARPTATADSYTLDEDAPPPVFASVLANDKDANNAPLSAVLETGPSHGTLSFNADGTFSYQPEANYFGQDAFTYHASNGKDASDAAVVTLSINPVNDAPTAVNDSAATNEDTAITGNVLDGSNGGLDTDPDHDVLTVTTAGTFTTGHGASVTLNANGDFSYDPTVSSELQALASGAKLVDGFDYSISDGHGGTSSAHVDVTVQGRNEASAGALLLPSVNPGTHLSYYLRYTDSSGASKWMPVDGFSVGSGSNISIGQGGSGAAIGKAAPDAFTIDMGTGKALTDLTTHLLKGTSIASIELEAYADTERGPQVLQEYKLTNALLTSVQTSAGQDGATSNTLSFAYKTMGESVAAVDQQGKLTKPITVGWDVTTNDTDAPLPTAGANADLKNLAPVQSSSAALDYYVHIDGVDGWTALSSFSIGYSANSSWTKGSGASVGKPVLGDVTMGLGLNQALTNLLKDEIAGTSNASVQVEAYAPHGGTDNGPSLVDEYFFNAADTTSVDSTSDAANTISLAYKSFTHSHLAYDASTGHADSADSGSTGYDVLRGTTISAPAASANAIVTTPLPGVDQGTGMTYYMRYTDSSGASKWLQIDGFSVGSHANSSIAQGGSGASVGKAVPDDFTIDMGTGKALTDFTTHLFKGTSIASIELEAYADTERGPQVLQEYKLTSALLTSVQTATGQDGATSNTLSFAYKTLGESVATVDQQGRLTKPITVGWDVTTNSTDVPLPTAGANADLKNLAPVQSSSAALDYYVHIDGVAGWTALSSFSMGYSEDSSWTKGSGASVGKPVPTDVTMGLGLNQELVTLLKDEITGKANAAVQVEAYASHGSADGTPVLVDEYFFNTAYTTSVSNNNEADNTVSLAYKSYTHSHLAYNDTTGHLDSADSGSTGYDLVQGLVRSAPSTVPEALATGAQMSSVSPGTGLSYYLRYTDSSGASKWLQIDGFSVGSHANSSIAQGGSGASVGKAVPDDFTIDMGTGKALTDFTTHLLKGTSIASIELEAYADTERGPQVLQEYKLTNALLTSVQTTTGQDGATSNALSFAYKTLGESVATVDQQGRLTTPITAGWDVATNSTDAPLPTAGANADLRNLAPMESSGAALDYYVHIDGVAGWTALSSFSMGYTADSSWTKGSGASVGKPLAADVTMGLGLNQVLTTLLQDEIAGTSNASIQVEAYTPHGGTDNGPSLVDEYFFNAAYVSAVNNADDAANTISLAYKSYTHSHLAYDENGHLESGSGGSVGYNVVTATTIGVPAAHADLFPQG